jgi:hypothetical protein
MSADDDVIIASVASLARRPEVLATLLADPRLFAAFDEAHHAPATSNRAVLDRLRGHANRSLLGLTATPTRTRPSERPLLGELFGNRIIHEADADDLVERGVLARPVIVRVETQVEVDRDLTPADLAALEQAGDFSRPWLNGVARIERRNRVVVDHLLKHRVRYGKTLVFAITVDQAVALTKRLRDAGVAADYVASRRRDNRGVLRRFQDGSGGLDVIVNVGLLTEGVDLPKVQSVVLARPTASSILAQQMAGRALRGPAVGGTELAYIVALRDDWRRFPRWRDPLDLVPDLAALAASNAPRRPVRWPAAPPPWGALDAVAPRIRALIPGGSTGSIESAADCWYVLDDPIAGDAKGVAIAIYGHQHAGWEAAVAHLGRLSADDLGAVDPATLLGQFFDDCEAPLPSPQALARLLGHFRGGAGHPASYGLEERMACDPGTLARLIVADDLGERARTELLVRRYTPLARALYPTMRDYRAAVDDAVYMRNSPDKAPWAEAVRPVFEAAVRDRD